MQVSIFNEVKFNYNGCIQVTAEIRDLSIQILESKNAIGSHVVRMCYFLHKLKAMLSDDFTAYCEDVFGFSRRQIWKFSSIGELIETNFLANGRSPDMALLDNFGVEAMLLLSTKSDEETIDGAKELATQGPVRKSDIEELLKAKAAAKEAKEEVAMKDRELSRQQEQIIQLNGSLDQKRQALEAASKALYAKVAELSDSDQEIERLHQEKRDLQASMKSKPIEARMSASPDSGQPEARNLLDGLNSEITRAQERRDKLKAQIEASERELADTAGKLGAAKQAVATLDDLISEVDGVIAKFPDTLLGKLRGALPGAAGRLNAYADKLRDLANHIAA